MHKVVVFDHSQSMDVWMKLPEANEAGAARGNGVVTSRVTSEKKCREINENVGLWCARSGRICCNFNRLPWGLELGLLTDWQRWATPTIRCAPSGDGSRVRLNTGKFRASFDVAEQLRQLAANSPDPADALLGDRLIGLAQVYLGDHVSGRR
jgi:hypothetical protein